MSSATTQDTCSSGQQAANPSDKHITQVPPLEEVCAALDINDDGGLDLGDDDDSEASANHHLTLALPSDHGEGVSSLDPRTEPPTVTGHRKPEGLNGKSIFKLRLRLYVPPYTLSASELGICSLSMIGTLFEQVCYEDVSFLSSPPLWLLSTVFNQSCHLVAGSSASLALASTGEIYGVLLRDVSSQSLVGVTD
nr:hypothetical protein Iba_chr09cCG12410 [Ipomoea batatas]